MPTDPTTDPDTQEALSLRYSNKAVLLLPLKSGRIAIFSRDFQLHTILDDTPTPDELKQLSFMLETKLAAKIADYELARLMGEPSDKQFVRDIQRQERQPKPRQPKVIGIEL